MVVRLSRDFNNAFVGKIVHVRVKHNPSVILNTGGYGEEINTGLLCLFC